MGGNFPKGGYWIEISLLSAQRGFISKFLIPWRINFWGSNSNLDQMLVVTLEFGHSFNIFGILKTNLLCTDSKEISNIGGTPIGGVSKPRCGAGLEKHTKKIQIYEFCEGVHFPERSGPHRFLCFRFPGPQFREPPSCFVFRACHDGG